MIVERIDGRFHTETELIIFTDERRDPWTAYRVMCLEWDMTTDGERIPPTARVSLLSSTSADFETVRRLAREYDYVADLAEQLQAEKRAAYAAQFGQAD